MKILSIFYANAYLHKTDGFRESADISKFINGVTC